MLQKTLLPAYYDKHNKSLTQTKRETSRLQLVKMKFL